MKREECPRCGALWLDGQHYWYTGRIGNERDLSNLVCGQKILMTVSIPVTKQDIYMVRLTLGKREVKLIDSLTMELDDFEED